MLANRSIPRCTVIPELAYPDVAEAIDWLRDAFGFTLRLRIANHRAQLNVGDCAVVLTERRGDAEGVPTHSVMVRVDDVSGTTIVPFKKAPESCGRQPTTLTESANTRSLTQAGMSGRFPSRSPMSIPWNGAAPLAPWVSLPAIGRPQSPGSDSPKESDSTSPACSLTIGGVQPVL
jgi:uncharacterized glyoxalase superfamily protein PhnB